VSFGSLRARHRTGSTRTAEAIQAFDSPKEKGPGGPCVLPIDGGFAVGLNLYGMRYLVLLTLLYFQSQYALAFDATGQLAAVRDIAVTITPGLAKTATETQIATLLRDQVHRTGIVAGLGVPSLTSAELNDWANAYRLSHLTRERANACNGKAILFMIALRAFGIKSRIVTMYATKEAGLPVYSHAAVDVFADGNWIAMDPTFNHVLKNERGEYISWREAVERYRKNKTVEITTDGLPSIKDDYFYLFERVLNRTYRDYTKFVLLGPSADAPYENLTSEWDGKIRYIDGTEFDAIASVNSHIYRMIAY
jgi:hypothetical protein